MIPKDKIVKFDEVAETITVDRDGKILTISFEDMANDNICHRAGEEYVGGRMCKLCLERNMIKLAATNNDIIVIGMTIGDAAKEFEKIGFDYLLVVEMLNDMEESARVVDGLESLGWTPEEVEVIVHDAGEMVKAEEFLPLLNDKPIEPPVSYMDDVIVAIRDGEVDLVHDGETITMTTEEFARKEICGDDFETHDADCNRCLRKNWALRALVNNPEFQDENLTDDDKRKMLLDLGAGDDAVDDALYLYNDPVGYHIQRALEALSYDDDDDFDFTDEELEELFGL